MKLIKLNVYGLILLSAIYSFSAAAVASQTRMPDKSAPAADEQKVILQTIGDTTGSDAKIIDFDFTDFNGKTRKLSEFRGKLVLLDFWATWCAPCLADIPKLKAIYQKHKTNGFEIIGMNVETIGDDADAPDAESIKEANANARKIVAERKVSWTIAMSTTAVPIASKIFNIDALPAKILIGKQGKIIAVVGEKDDLAQIVEKLLEANK